MRIVQINLSHHSHSYIRHTILPWVFENIGALYTYEWPDQHIIVEAEDEFINMFILKFDSHIEQSDIDKILVDGTPVIVMVPQDRLDLHEIYEYLNTNKIEFRSMVTLKGYDKLCIEDVSDSILFKLRFNL